MWRVVCSKWRRREPKSTAFVPGESCDRSQAESTAGHWPTACRWARSWGRDTNVFGEAFICKVEGCGCVPRRCSLGAWFVVCGAGVL